MPAAPARSDTSTDALDLGPAIDEGSQTLIFPSREMGTMYSANPDTINTPLKFGPAQGRVVGPPGRTLLYKPSDAVIADPTLLKQLPANIHGIDLYNANVSDEFIRKLTIFKDLRYLRLSEVEVTEGDLDSITQFPKLNTLILNHCDLKAVGLNKLGRLHDLQALVLQSTACTGATIAKVSDIKSLRRLNVSKTRADDQSLKAIGTLVNLTHLDISKARITDKGLSALPGLKRLRRLAVSNNDIGDPGVKYIAMLPDLRQLDCYNDHMSVSSSAVAALRACHALRVLDFSRVSLKDDAVAALVTACPKLTNLILSDVKTLSDKGFQNLGRLTAVQYLVVSNTHAGDGTAQALSKSRTLTSLDMQHTDLTDKGVGYLATLPHLSALVISDNQKLTDESAKALSKGTPVRSLSFDSTPITDASVPFLSKIKTLTGLVVLETKISPKGFADLKKALPGCAIAF